METTSESDSYDRTPSRRPRGREAHGRAGGDRGRSGARGADISEKISTLAVTLQDTSRNLTKVDKMLEQYRDQTGDQADAMALLRNSLEESISQLQSQRVNRSSDAHSSSASPLRTSDVEGCSGSDGQRFYPTSPLKDYTDPQGRRRRSHSAGVRFKTAGLPGEDIHTLHQSLRDLRCNQQRLSVELDREILRRNRSDIDTRRALESLTEHLTTPQKQESVSSRVEQRLQELEREMHSEREWRPDRQAATPDEPQETFGGHKVKGQRKEELRAAGLLKAERDKLEQDLERARRLLEQSEGSRESLLHQVEDMRGELLRTRKDKAELQRMWAETPQSDAQQHAEDARGGRRVPDLEKEIAELRAQLRKVSVGADAEDATRASERQERERVQLSLKVEEMSSDLVRRDQQHLRLLEQLKEIESRGQAEKREMQEVLRESRRSREELKARAQEAVCQWRAKCRRLRKELEEAVGEKESSRAQLKALSQQAEAAHRELAEILGRLAQREEELRRKDVELSATCQRQLTLEQDIREANETSAALKEEIQHQANIQAGLREENQRLRERADTQDLRGQRDQRAQAELHVDLKQAAASRAQIARRLAEEEKAKKELQATAGELQAKLAAALEERAALRRQLELEREVHREELGNMAATVEGGRAKKHRELQDMLSLCRQERDEIKTRLQEVKADAAADKKLCEALRVKLDRMKDECDKLTAQLSDKEDDYTRIQDKYQRLKSELDDEVRSGERGRESESELVKLREKVSRMEAEQESVLTSVGDGLDAACRGLSRNDDDKFQAIAQKPGLVKDLHRWLAETKTKLCWLCEEVRERDTREQRLRRQHQHARDQLKALRRSRDSENAAMLERLDRQEKQLHSLSAEKIELSEKSRRKDEEIRSLQYPLYPLSRSKDRVLDLETNTRVALDHLESIPEKHRLMENFRDLEESQRQRDMMEQRYAKYKEVVWDLQHQLNESECKMQEYREEKLDTTSRSLRLAALSTSVKSPAKFVSSTPRTETLFAPRKRPSSPDFEESLIPRAEPPAD